MSNKNRLEDSIRQRIEYCNQATPEEQIHDSVQILTELEKIDSQAAFDKVKLRLETGTKYLKIYRTFSRIAAILVLPLLIAFTVLIYKINFKEVQFAMQEISTPKGLRSHIDLPDGSHVWLNSESTIKFKVPFDKKERNVFLTGEAFFDVKKNPHVPFVVNSGKVNVNVLGTKFNYKAYTDEDIEVVLAEGKIRMDVNGSNNQQKYMMQPGERAVVNKLTGVTTIDNENIDKYIAWHQGKLVFDEMLLPEVAKNLSRWYGVDVIINDASIKRYRITTTFENESLQQVIDLLKISSPIDIQLIPASVNGNVQTQTKIIFNKSKH